MIHFLNFLPDFSFSGVTGPVLVYDEALYKFTKDYAIEFLPCRFWISIWSVIIAIVVAAFQGSVVVKFFTKFTKDIFAGFVATVFIYEALLQTVGVSKNHMCTRLFIIIALCIVLYRFM